MEKDRVSFRFVKPDEIEECYKIEVASYPSDEAASLENMKLRLRNAPKLFVGGYLDGKMIGFVCATKCTSFTEEAMKTHNTKGSLIAIHSVVVRSEYRRKGMATNMLKHYLQLIKGEENVKEVVLICHPIYLNLYLNCGFNCTGLSKIVHGAGVWLDCKLRFHEIGNPRFFVVDAFTTIPGRGNPAAVVLLFDESGSPISRSKDWMQKVAAEFNLSETVFISKLDEENHYNLLFFAPTTQIVFCGHATLASSHVLFSEISDKDVETKLKFYLSDGQSLGAEKKSEGMIQLTFPSHAPKTTDLENSQIEVLEEALEISREDIVHLAVYETSCLLELSSSAFTKLFNTEIDFKSLKTFHFEFVIVCTKTLDLKQIASTPNEFDFDEFKTTEFDFYSRFFTPINGINEDPVTGSAHSVLFPHFSRYYPGKKQLNALQASKRGGILIGSVQTEVAGEKDKVIIDASAIVVSRGVLRL